MYQQIFKIFHFFHNIILNVALKNYALPKVIDITSQLSSSWPLCSFLSFLACRCKMKAGHAERTQRSTRARRRLEKIIPAWVENIDQQSFFNTNHSMYKV